MFERALEFVSDGMAVGLGSGRAANRFTELLGERVRNGLRVRTTATSEATAELARRSGLSPLPLAEVMPLDLTVDGADEVDPNLDLIKGYGRALVREKVVASVSKRLVIVVGSEKMTPRLGTRGKLPVEVVPFAAATVLYHVRRLGYDGRVFETDGRPFVSDNGNYILDVAVAPMSDVLGLQQKLQAIPGVVDTGLFLGMADTVLVGDDETFRMTQELRRPHGKL
ncbi:MAG: ribose-5-phosphate isomerase RpiA [Pirellula sp.]|nr:ribose-5-phosphate isomerase RpiA [Pirellula sp.]